MSLKVKILQFMYENPEASNKEIAKELKLKLSDVTSTLDKLYRKVKEEIKNKRKRKKLNRRRVLNEENG